jgi:hypothetical protein
MSGGSPASFREKYRLASEKMKRGYEILRR